MQSFLSQFGPPGSAAWKLCGHHGQAQRDGTAIKCAATQMGLPAQNLHKTECVFPAQAGRQVRGRDLEGRLWGRNVSSFHPQACGLFLHGPETPSR